ncbi:hypothetical protein EVAR_102012_1 [Eumeta japonica]|uniref:Uncharacterized protein n=1 Tax=Eumeta variegata TaxID=151549 RepID=A0A4C2A9U5_EUMVA|nr:hypothetical protein EVAR_102012_1 [Eumeta japonica]
MVVFRHDLQGFLSTDFEKKAVQNDGGYCNSTFVSQNVYRNSTIATVDRYRLKPRAPFCAVVYTFPVSFLLQPDDAGDVEGRTNIRHSMHFS